MTPDAPRHSPSGGQRSDSSSVLQHRSGRQRQGDGSDSARTKNLSRDASDENWRSLNKFAVDKRELVGGMCATVKQVEASPAMVPCSDLANNATTLSRIDCAVTR